MTAFSIFHSQLFSMPIKLLLADDFPVVRQGIAAAVESTEIEIVGCVDRADELFSQIAKLKPDVLVAEIRLSGQDLLKLLESPPAEYTASNCRLILFSANSNPTGIARASTLDCYDYLLKSQPIEDLVDAIQNTVTGHSTSENSLLKTSQNRLRDTSHWKQVHPPLTQREVQVLQHLAMGMTNREIGRSLGNQC